MEVTQTKNKYKHYHVNTDAIHRITSFSQEQLFLLLQMPLCETPVTYFYVSPTRQFRIHLWLIKILPIKQQKSQIYLLIFSLKIFEVVFMYLVQPPCQYSKSTMTVLYTAFWDCLICSLEYCATIIILTAVPERSHLCWFFFVHTKCILSISTQTIPSEIHLN